jgi:anti-anti-sigma factor
MNTRDSSTVPACVTETIGGIVDAVRAGDDARIRILLERLAQVADTAALLLLRHRLNEDLPRRPVPACDTDPGRAARALPRGPPGLDRTPGQGFLWIHGPRPRSNRTQGDAVYDTIHVDVHATAPGTCRVTVAGDLDVVSAPAVRDTLREAISRHPGGVEVDCAQLTFCDCSGLSALMAAARAAKADGVELRLCAVPHPLARLLRLTHTGSAFTIEREQPGVR